MSKAYVIFEFACVCVCKVCRKLLAIIIVIAVEIICISPTLQPPLSSIIMKANESKIEQMGEVERKMVFQMFFSLLFHQIYGCHHSFLQVLSIIIIEIQFKWFVHSAKCTHGIRAQNHTYRHIRYTQENCTFPALR